MHRLGRMVAAVAGVLMAVSLAGVVAGAAPASAAGGGGCAGFGLGVAGWAVVCGTPGSSGTTGGGGDECTDYDLPEAVKLGLITQKNADLWHAPVGYIFLVVDCPPNPPTIELFTKTGTVTTDTLANQAYATLAPPNITPKTAPPVGAPGVGVVGLAMWFWIPAPEYKTMTRTIKEGGLTATVTATPGPMVLMPGDGQPNVTCAGPGTAYNPSEPASAQHSDCTILYTKSSANVLGKDFTAAISVTWTAVWRGSNDTGGDLPPITKIATVNVVIENAETVITGE